MNLASVGTSAKWSITSFGTMRPKVTARMIIVAVMPLATVAPNSSTVACEPLPAICTKPLASLNRYTPGIIDTTEAKPMAAKGVCVDTTPE